MAEPWLRRASSTIDIAATPTGSPHWSVHPASLKVGVRDAVSVHATNTAAPAPASTATPAGPGPRHAASASPPPIAAAMIRWGRCLRRRHTRAVWAAPTAPAPPYTIAAGRGP